MKVVDQAVEEGMTALQTALARSNRVARKLLYDRMNGLTHPTLPIHAFQARLDHEIRTRFALRRDDLAIPSNWWNQIIRVHMNAVKASISQLQRDGLRILSRALSQRPDEMAITISPYDLSGTHDQQLSVQTTYGPFDPFPTLLATPQLVVGTGLVGTKSGRVQ